MHQLGSWTPANQLNLSYSFPEVLAMIDRRAHIPTGFAFAILAFALAAPPAFAVNKDMVQLQTEVQQLQDAVSRLQQSNDERMGVLKDLVQQNADSVNKMSLLIENLQKNLASQQEASSGKVDQLSNQAQALNDSVDEVKARLNNLEKGLQAVQSQLQSINAALQNLQLPAGSAPGAASGASPSDVPSGVSQPQGQPGPVAYSAKPSPDIPFPPQQGPYANAPAAPASPSAAPIADLYNAALRDYMAAKYPLSTTEFTQVIHSYPTDQLAGNSYYYIGEIDYRAGKFSAAVKDYDQVINQYPGNAKIPVAHLHKAQALIAMKDRDAGIAELRALIQRFPNTTEAAQARTRLNGLGAHPAPARNE
jgi:TolA-binding protein